MSVLGLNSKLFADEGKFFSAITLLPKKLKVAMFRHDDNSRIKHVGLIA